MHQGHNGSKELPASILEKIHLQLHLQLHKIKKGKGKEQNDEIPDCSHDQSSLNDGVDYNNPEYYVVKKIIGHKTVVDKKEEPVLKLFTRWKGWREK
jgi:hypothetical protein